MEFSTSHFIIIFVVIDIIIFVLILNYIRKKRRQKQEEEMNSFNTFSSISKPKNAGYNPNYTEDQTISTGEVKTTDIFSVFDKDISEAEAISTFEKNIENLAISEEQKKLILEKLKTKLANKTSFSTTTNEFKINSVENSELSEEQKKTMIDFIKSKEK